MNDSFALAEPQRSCAKIVMALVHYAAVIGLQ